MCCSDRCSQRRCGCSSSVDHRTDADRLSRDGFPAAVHERLNLRVISSSNFHAILCCIGFELFIRHNSAKKRDFGSLFVSLLLPYSSEAGGLRSWVIILLVFITFVAVNVNILMMRGRVGRNRVDEFTIKGKWVSNLIVSHTKNSDHNLALGTQRQQSARKQNCSRQSMTNMWTYSVLPYMTCLHTAGQGPRQRNISSPWNKTIDAVSLVSLYAMKPPGGNTSA